MKPIAYEPHPVTPERKAELVAAGLKIIDAKHKPVDEQDATPEPVKRGRKQKVATDAS